MFSDIHSELWIRATAFSVNSITTTKNMPLPRYNRNVIQSRGACYTINSLPPNQSSCFSQSYNFPPTSLPRRTQILSLVHLKLTEARYAPSTIVTTVSAVAFANKLVQGEDPRKHFLVNKMLKAPRNWDTRPIPDSRSHSKYCICFSPRYL